jgi:KDO2-lipid IV(A) lauroyltransferase
MFGVGLIEVGVSARGVIAALRKGRAVAMLSDQDAGADGVIVDFLGRPASTPKGPAAFALKTGCPIFVISFVRNELDKHVLYIEGPIIMKKTEDKEKDIKQLTQAYTDIIEKYVKLHPDHWFWAHRRWKTTCPEDYH